MRGRRAPRTAARRSVVEQLRDLRHRIAHGAGELPAIVRAAALSGSAVPAAARAYADKVRHHAYKVTDGDVDELKKAGWSEDEIFELTIAAAVGAGMSRLDKALAAMQEAGG